MERSHSPADLSIDESQGFNRKRPNVFDDDVETSTAEARELQNVQG